MIIYAVLVLLCSLLWVALHLVKKADKKQPPRAAESWPLFGHLHLLRGPTAPHIVLGNMADTCGPIFTINLGIRQAIVVNDWVTAKECFTINDKIFASRPKSMAAEILGYDASMVGFSPYGNYWRDIRKLSSLELLSAHRLATFKDVRESEVRFGLRNLHSLWEMKRDDADWAEVEMKKFLGDVMLNLICRIVVGKRAGYDSEKKFGIDRADWKDRIKEFFELSGKFVLSDGLPFLRWLDVGKEEKAMKMNVKGLEGILDEWMKEHREMKNVREEDVEKEGKDFMGILMDILSDSRSIPDGRNPDLVIKATCLGMILGGSDTAAVAMSWAVALLLRNPEILRKAQEEIEKVVGEERLVRESDTSNMEYLNAILMETMRLHPPGPLAIPHESTADCTVAGYHIPSGTMMFPNIWKIHRDPRVWDDPDEFRPERFLRMGKEMDPKGQHLEFMPFGSGRRRCPGANFALPVLRLTLASILHGFEIASSSAVDLTEGMGLTCSLAAPLVVKVKPRIFPNLKF